MVQDRMKRMMVTVIVACILGGAVYSQDQASAFKQEGLASWYGVDFDGKPTASGEFFDSTQMTAAHPTLPFGTQLKVTNKENNRSVTVRVNDRGPFNQDRIIDLSQAAAAQLDFIAAGSAPVVVEMISEQSVAAATILPALPPTESNKKYRIQVGSYETARNAVKVFDALKLVVNKLKTPNLTPAYEKYEYKDREGKLHTAYRVVLASISAKDVPDIVEKLVQAGFMEIWIREEL
ncbi:MAG: septal ring lytic transglycosylase RlpA family protein [Spirochaetaceae bacterium]|jgi:rare lipoprotein A|nr:septal ring lytic transglycosylase RlpA family protein [Spirochaetaceae bacterium]